MFAKVDNDRHLTFRDAICLTDSKALDLHKLLITLQDRCASNPVDLVGGILHFCRHEPEIPSLARPLPAYHSSERPDVAWTRLVHACAQVFTESCRRCIGSVGNADNHFVVQLLGLFPIPQRSTGSLV